MSKGRKIIGALALAGATSVAINTLKNNTKESKANVQSLRISILSDIHYFSPTMIKDCEDFKRDKIKYKKLLEESSAILDSALNKVKVDKVDVLLICGDLTREGELKGHIEVADKLRKLQEKEKKLKIYVVNGEHDINNDDALDFSKGKAYKADKTTLEDFKKIYDEFRFTDEAHIFRPVNGQAGCLSYVVSPKEGFKLIVADVCKYSDDGRKTEAIISDELKNWIINEAHKAKKNGDTVILTMHYGLIPHFSKEGEIFGDCLVKNYEVLNKEFADAGIKYVLTGHLHANNISNLITKKGNMLYDISTASAITYPCTTRIIDFYRRNNNGKIQEEVEININQIRSIDFIDKSTGKKIKDLKSYCIKNFNCLEYLNYDVKSYIDIFLERIRHKGGLENYLSEILNTDIGDYVLDILKKELPSREKYAVYINEKFKVYFDSANMTLVIIVKSIFRKVRLKITSYAIKKEIVFKGLKKVESKLLNDTSYICFELEKVIEDLLNTNFYSNDLEKKNVLNLLNAIFFSLIDGKEKVESWVMECVENFKAGKNIDILLNTICTEIEAIVSENASILTYDAERLVSRTSGLISKIVRKSVVSHLGQSLGDILKAADIDIYDKMLDLVFSFVRNGKREEYGRFIGYMITSAVTKSNDIEDSNTIIKDIR